MVANIGPSSSNLAETLSTLRFAQRAKSIKNKAVVNEDTLGNVSSLQAEIARLKDELASARTLSVVRTQPASEAAEADGAAVKRESRPHAFKCGSKQCSASPIPQHNVVLDVCVRSSYKQCMTCHVLT